MIEGNLAAQVVGSRKGSPENPGIQFAVRLRSSV